MKVKNYAKSMTWGEEMFKSMRFRMAGARNTVFFKYLVSYLFVLLLPVTIGALLFSRIESIMVEEAHKSHSTMLMQVRDVLDKRFKEIEQLSLQISLDEKLNYMLMNQQNIRNYDYVTYVKDLKKYQTVSSQVEDFYIYFIESDVLLSPN